MTCNNKCIHFPVCEQKKFDFANIDECEYYQEEQPTGEWIESCKISSSEYFRNKENFIESKCSNCNRWSLRLDFQMEDKFCPLCGAKMKEYKRR